MGEPWLGRSPLKRCTRCCACWRASAAPVAPDSVVPVALSTPSKSSRDPGGVTVGFPERPGDESITYLNGSQYQGQVVENKRHGRGTLVLSDGTRYEAEWRNDKRHGEGMEFCPDGTRFNGAYVNGFRSGHGVMTWPEGSRYVGQFEHDKANGEGMLLRTDGSVYQGRFSEDSMSGEGRMRWTDGGEYVGQFVANRRDGKGKMLWVTGRWKSYEGGWKDSLQHGHGTLVDRSDGVFTGLFHSGKLVRWVDENEGDEKDSMELEVPRYWSNQNAALGFSERTECTEAQRNQVQKLLDDTFRSVRTRDRSGQVPSRLRLVKCHRVENSEMWGRYVEAKKRIAARRPDGVKKVNELDGDPSTGLVKTQVALEDAVMEQLDVNLNEHYLWHGTTPEGALGISTNGFRIALAGSRAGTYFGRGCYFAECSSKSDEYAREGDNLLAGVYALLLCRVTCGSLFRTTEPDGKAIELALAGGDYDAVLGDREASAGTFREFVVYDEELVYPEFVVLYERKFAEQPPPKT